MIVTLVDDSFCSNSIPRGHVQGVVVHDEDVDLEGHHVDILEVLVEMVDLAVDSF